MAVSNRFSFVGTIVIPKPDSKRPLLMDGESHDHTTHYRRSTFGVKESDRNMAWVEQFGAAGQTIRTADRDGNKIEIDWKDRFDEDVVKNVANYRKFVLNLGDDYGGRQEFVAAYDFLGAVSEWLPKYNGRVVVTGQFSKDFYNGKYMDRFQFQSIYAVTDDERKNRLGVTLDLYYNVNSLDTAEWKDSKRLYLNGYVSQYINKDEGNKYMPHQTILDATKFDESNERHMKLLKYRKKYLQVKNKTYVHVPWECVLLSGAETVEFTADMLTDAQREQVELGIKSIDDFRPRGDIYGSKIVEYRLFDPKLTGDFENGVVDTELTESEFENEIFEPATEEKLEDVLKEAEDKKSEDKAPFDADESSVDDDELF